MGDDMAAVTENIIWLSGGGVAPNSGLSGVFWGFFVVFFFYKNNIEMFMHCFMEQIPF